MSTATHHRIIIGDVLDGLRSLPDGLARCCVTSPPYWSLRDYGMSGQIGLESTPEAYIERMVGVFREVRRVLTDDGTLWLNIGDSYTGAANSGGVGKQDTMYRGEGLPCKGGAGLKPKDLVGIPWMLAFALRADGWYLRSDIIWAKPNPMPESVTDRPTKSHEYVFLLSKRERYYYDHEAVKECRTDSNSSRFAAIQVADATLGEAAPLLSDKARDAANPYSKQNRGVRGVPGVGTTWLTDDPATRNARTVWTIATQPYSEAHFATYPEALPERCVKAGSSERGKCPECGAAWVRVVEKTMEPNPGGGGKRADTPGCEVGLSSVFRTGMSMVGRTVGWEPTCTHGHDPIPDTVLDPFTGSGTTLLVACRLGRNGIGCELNPEYAAMAERRIGSGLRPSTFRDDKLATDAPLFGATA